MLSRLRGSAAEFGVFVLALPEFLLATWLLLRRPPGWSGWLRAFLAGVAWLVVWYAPIPIEVGAVVTLVVLWLLLPRGFSHVTLRVPPVAAAERRTRWHRAPFERLQSSVSATGQPC